MEIQSSALAANQAASSARAQAPTQPSNEGRKVANDAAIERKELERSERKQADQQRETRREEQKSVDRDRARRLDVRV